MKHKQPGSRRGQIRNYMMAQDFGKKITIERISAALGFDHADILSAMSFMIRDGEPFQVVTKAKAWTYIPEGVEMHMDPDDAPIKKQRNLPGASQIRRNILDDAHERELGPAYGWTGGNGLPKLKAVHHTQNGRIVLEDDLGVIWVATKALSQ